METTRFILLVAMSLVILQLWLEWQKDYGQDEVIAEQGIIEPAKEHGLDIPQSPEIITASKPPAAKTTIADSSTRVKITTDVYYMELDTVGGGISHAELLKYPVALEQPEQFVRLLYDSSPQIYVLQGGMLSDNSAPTHEERYTTQQTEYTLDPGNEILEIPLFWESDNGIKIKKIYTFRRGQHRIKVRYEIKNNSVDTWSGRVYAQLQRTDPGSSRVRMIYTYNGAVISSPENRYEKIDFDDMRENKLASNITNGWVAMLQHYFISALIPGSKTEEYHYYTLALENDRFAIGAITPAIDIKQGQEGTIEQVVYIGPKIQEDLQAIAPGLELTVDYGVLWFIAKPLFWCLQKFHLLTGNWGWSIILVTLMLKILFYQLSAAGYRSMANMRRVQPRLLSIRDRYKNDKARLNKAMMDIYKEEKINPLGGCFPILVQIPVFIALYWVLLESVELRQTGFVLWIKDLSSPDPFFVLPIVMGATMLIQQKLNPAPMDPVQEKVMMALPIVFTVFFAFFPSGLVLYWVANNILSIAQQWMITRNLERAGLKR